MEPKQKKSGGRKRGKRGNDKKRKIERPISKATEKKRESRFKELAKTFRFPEAETVFQQPQIENGSPITVPEPEKKIALPQSICANLPKNAKIVEIELVNDSHGLGFSFFISIFGTFVSSVLDGGVAKKDGRLSVGDKLLAVSINGTLMNFHNLNEDVIVYIMRSITNKVTLIVARGSHSVNKASMPESKEKQPQLPTADWRACFFEQKMKVLNLQTELSNLKTSLATSMNSNTRPVASTFF